MWTVEMCLLGRARHKLRGLRETKERERERKKKRRHEERTGERDFCGRLL